jgi:hypothetical protein
LRTVAAAYTLDAAVPRTLKAADVVHTTAAVDTVEAAAACGLVVYILSKPSRSLGAVAAAHTVEAAAVHTVEAAAATVEAAAAMVVAAAVHTLGAAAARTVPSSCKMLFPNPHLS